ncbi:MAG: amino acid ABC transporter permease [Chloroflexota bacterium]
MTTLYQNFQSVVRGEEGAQINFRDFIRDNITNSWWLALAVLFLTYVAARLVIAQTQAAPVTTLIIVGVWLLSVTATVMGNITHHHSRVTMWLSRNLYTSLASTLVTLILLLLVVAALRGFIGWAFVRASFSTDPEVAAETLAQWDNPGANWGAVIDNFRNLMVFRFPREQSWRIWALILWNVLLLIPSGYVFSREVFRRSRLRTVLIILWLFTPILAYILLRGFGTGGPVPVLNPDLFWGGLLLTLIIAVFGIVASFPLGVVLSLGRRSQIRGIPAWLTYGITGLLTVYLLITTTFPALRTATGIGQQLLAFWPLLIMLAAFLFQKYFKGNAVAMLSTVYIEVIRGVPLITILFMSIILFPIFLPPGVEVLSTWRVLAAVALFAAAYLAENIRGGLQSIPKGQYEAADAIGLSTAKKYRLIILPQALRAVIPAIVGQFIGLFKDTTLVAIVGLIELLGVANLISAQPDWLGVRREPYVFIAIIYFIGSYAMAGYSRRLERQLGVGER